VSGRRESEDQRIRGSESHNIIFVHHLICQCADWCIQYHSAFPATHDSLSHRHRHCNCPLGSSQRSASNLTVKMSSGPSVGRCLQERAAPSLVLYLPCRFPYTTVLVMTLPVPDPVPRRRRRRYSSVPARSRSSTSIQVIGSATQRQRIHPHRSCQR
jgi:hypothetical protein